MNDRKPSGERMSALPKRECGECRVCCIVPEIKVPELTKAAGVHCPHLCNAGCSIQEAKPATCRTFNCAWRLMPEVDDGWRPDRVGILGIPGFTEGGRRAIQFIPFRSARVLAQPTIISELRRLASTIEVWLGLSRAEEWPPSYKVHLNNLPNRRAWRKLGGLSNQYRAMMRTEPQRNE